MNSNFRNPDLNYDNSLNFPPLGQGTVKTKNNSLNLNDNPVPSHHHNSGSQAISRLHSAPLSSVHSKTLNSQSKDFIPSSGASSSFLNTPSHSSSHSLSSSLNSSQHKQMSSATGSSTTISHYNSVVNSSKLASSSLASLEAMENDKEFAKVIEYIALLKNPERREEALQELSKKKDSFPRLAYYLWHSVGIVTILIQEIVSIYPALSPPTLTQSVSYKICNVLGLLQCLALSPETRGYFLSYHLPMFLYPLLNTTNKSKPYENLRVTSLGVIGALVKGDDSEAISILMHTEIIPFCLRIMKRGQELSRTVATFIIQKILLDDNGMNYICQTGERFFAICTVLNHMVADLVATGKDDQRLIRHIVRCYLRLAENTKARESLKKILPEQLRNVDSKFITDEAVKKWQLELLKMIGLDN